MKNLYIGSSFVLMLILASFLLGRSCGYQDAIDEHFDLVPKQSTASPAPRSVTVVETWIRGSF